MREPPSLLRVAFVRYVAFVRPTPISLLQSTHQNPFLLFTRQGICGGSITNLLCLLPVTQFRQLSTLLLTAFNDHKLPQRQQIMLSIGVNEHIRP